MTILINDFESYPRCVKHKHGGSHMKIRNWKNAEFKACDVSKTGDTFLISQHGDDWDIEITFSDLLFQGYGVYLI